MPTRWSRSLTSKLLRQSTAPSSQAQPCCSTPGWAHRKTDALSYAGTETTEDLKFPGFGVEASQLLVERGVVGLGVDTLGIDPGDKPDFPVHRHVTHPAGLWHLENLINVDQLPPVGAVIAVGVPRIDGGTGFPTRVFAFVSKN